jgi:hypothetical protein
MNYLRRVSPEAISALLSANQNRIKSLVFNPNHAPVESIGLLASSPEFLSLALGVVSSNLPSI